MPTGAYIDPVLKRLLAAATRNEPVGATITLRSGDGNRPLSVKETRETVDSLIDRVRRRTGYAPLELSVFENIQSFTLRAPASFVAGLLDEPEIDSALANEQEEDLMIRPFQVKKTRTG